VDHSQWVLSKISPSYVKSVWLGSESRPNHMARVQDIVEAAASILTGLQLTFYHILNK
jgi:hypothetical protein